MIVKVEDILSKTFLKIETVAGQNPIWFHYGDTKELDAVLSAKKGEKKYPLLWYVMPNRLTYEQNGANGKCTFILAHNTTLHWFNDQRFKKVYDEILFPYLENMLKALQKSHNVSFSSTSEYDFTNFPNYSVSTKTESPQDSFWDAIKIEIDLQIYNDNDC